MSLQGSIETIALADVMALLASSNKSGELRVVGNHIDGRLWMRDGLLVGSKVGRAHGHLDALFELLRLTEGNFVFKDGVDAPAPEEPTPVAPVVSQAEERLKEWHDIEVVVPSLEHRVRLIPDLPAPEVTLSAEQWRLVMATALAGTVHGVLEELGLGLFDGCRGLRQLVDAGLVIVDPPRVRPSASDPGRTGRRVFAANGSVISEDGESSPHSEESLESLAALAAAAAAAASGDVAPEPVDGGSPGSELLGSWLNGSGSLGAGMPGSESAPAGSGIGSMGSASAAAASDAGSVAPASGEVLGSAPTNSGSGVGSLISASMGSASGLSASGSDAESVASGAVGQDSMGPMGPMGAIGQNGQGSVGSGSMGPGPESVGPGPASHGASWSTDLAAEGSASLPTAPVAASVGEDDGRSPAEYGTISLLRPLPAHEDAAAGDAPATAAVPERDPEGDSINRGLLLKFLSSVRS